MRLDHISYVTSHDQLADTVQRLGARLGTSFVDGGIHPRFGTRNFTCALEGNQYLEVVCPLDHPATEETPWGKAVTKKAREGGGWFTWVFSVDDITRFEARFSRAAVVGNRIRPNGRELKWKQIGVKEISDAPTLPFFIEWLSNDHPSQDGSVSAKIEGIVISDKETLSNSWFKKEILESLEQIKIERVDPTTNDGIFGIVAVKLISPHGLIILD